MGRTGQNGQVSALHIAGRYRLVEKIGTGGMSVVWRGYDETLGRPVAVKVLAPRLADDRVFRDRLRQEAVAAACLCHPHITGIFDFGESPLSERLTVPYVVMELNDGESVAARLARQGPLPWREAVRVAAEVASALATAHARGVVHRDVTPANVMLTAAGAKVVDFGISAVVGQRDAAPDGSLLGTPAYLAPERLAGAQVTAATDVYALGLLLYRQLTGRLPWPAETTAEALRAHLYADPEPLPDLPGMPSTVGELCLRCLAKTPADRPDAAQAAHTLAATVDLQPILPPVRQRPAGAPPAVRAAAAPVPFPSPPRPALSPVEVSRAALAYLGLAGRRSTRVPEPVSKRNPPGAPGFPGGARLRAGLRIGRMLRLGSVQPLGGGLFAGGGLAREALTGGVLRGRHRLQAALLTGVLLTAAGLGWAITRDAPAVEQAQAAGPASAAAGPAGTICAVRYRLRRDSGSDYEALLTVATTEEVGRSSWRVQFSYPGSQRLTGAPKAVTQRGRKVIVKARGKLRNFALRGDYRDYNPLPLSFSLDGHRCHAEVLGATAANPDDGRAISEAAGPEKERPDRGAGGGEVNRHRPPSRSGTPRKRLGGTGPAAPPAPPAPPGTSGAHRDSGISLAL